MIFSQSIHRIPTGYRINIENKKGILSFWRGNLANCLRYVPKFALDMSLKSPIHKMYKDLLIPNPSLIPSSSSTEIYFLHFLTKWLSGASAAMVSTVICYPLDFARTKLATDLNMNLAYSGIWDCWRKTSEKEGFLAIYNGLSICLVGEVIYRGTKYCLYDTFQVILTILNPS